MCVYAYVRDHMHVLRANHIKQDTIEANHTQMRRFAIGFLCAYDDISTRIWCEKEFLP